MNAPLPADVATETPGEMLARLRRDHIEGHTVKYRRLAGNSLILYLDCEPGDKHGATIWLEPTWHLRGPESVLAGSRQAQDDPDAEDPEEGFREVAAAVDVLTGRRLVALGIDPVTGDLRADLEGGLVLQTFVCDPTDDHLWHIRDNATGARLRGTPAGLRIDPPRPRAR